MLHQTQVLSDDSNGACLWISISHFPSFGVHLVSSVWCDLVPACGPVFLIFLHLVSNEEFRENMNDEERGKGIKGVSELAPVHFNLFQIFLLSPFASLETLWRWAVVVACVLS